VPPFGPIQRRELVRCLQELGFEGPYSGGRHQFMIRGELRLHIPNPYQGDIGRALLSRLLHQADINR
jgi:predicted RNA binding protein YcfA (HicA-like mRNA interferase family)